MKLKLLLIVISITILFTSCDKKLYFSTENDKTVLQNENHNLSNESSIITSQQNEVQNQNSLLNKSFSDLTYENVSLKAENAKLKQQADDEVIAVNKAIITYFEKLGQIAHDNTPPCKNAANGWFREYIASPNVAALTTPAINPTTKTANNLLAVFTTYGSKNQAAFKNNGNYTLPFRYCCGTTSLEDFKAIIQLGKDIVALFGTNGTDVPTWANTAKDGYNLYNSINGTCHSGSHANGHISEGVNAAANNALVKLNSFHYDDQTTRVGKIKVVLEKCFTDLKGLQTQGHNPWLRPDWQVNYYVIMQATAQKLSALN